MKKDYNAISKIILDSAFEVHSCLGPGLLERVCQECLIDSLKEKGLHVQSEVEIPIQFKSKLLKGNFRIDLLVENTVVVEIKSVQELNDLHLAQVLTYLKLGEFKLGLLLNFNVTSMKVGIRRVIR